MLNEDYKSDKFKETLSQYEQSVQDGVSCYLDSDQIIAISNYYLDNDKPNDSKRILDMGRKIHPDNCQIRLSYVSALIFIKDYNSALLELESINSDDIDELYLRAQLFLAIDNDLKNADNLFEEWIALLNKELDEEEKDDFYQDKSDKESIRRNAVNLIILSFNDLTKEKEDRYIRKWINKYISDFSPLGNYKEDYVVANVCSSLEYFDYLEEVYSMLLEVNPYITHGFTMLGATQQVNGKTDDAIKSLEFALAIDPKDIQAIVTMAHCQMLKRNYDRALRNFLKYQDLTQSDNESFNIGLCFLYLNQEEKALIYFNKIFDATVKEIDPKDNVMQYICLAEAFYNCSDSSKAIEILNMIEEYAQDNKEFFVLKGYLQIDSSNIEEAIRCFTTAIKMADDFRELLIVISSRLIYMNQFELALYYLNIVKKSIDLPPVNCYYNNVYAFLSITLFNLGIYDESIDNLRIACEKVPDTVRQLWSSMPDSVNPVDYFEYIRKNYF